MYKKYDVFDIDIVENILSDFEQLETAYYNKLNINFPDYNKENPLRDKLFIRRTVVSCIQTSFEKFLRLYEKESNTTDYFSKDEYEKIREIRNLVSHEYCSFDEDMGKECVENIIPIIKVKLQAVMQEYQYYSKQQQKENLKFNPH